ncbi:MAG: hypothetical protein LBJ09_02030 [Clostridiales bacterium]|jgi:thiamine monophosphate kinase|nr:hypothetical protein [Clostridiales bacterium]
MDHRKVPDKSPAKQKELEDCVVLELKVKQLETDLKNGGAKKQEAIEEHNENREHIDKLQTFRDKLSDQIDDMKDELKSSLKELVKNTFPDFPKVFRKKLVKNVFKKSKEDIRDCYIKIKEEFEICIGTRLERMKELEIELKEIQLNMVKASEGDESASAFLLKKHLKANLPQIDEAKINDLISHVKDIIIQRQKAAVEAFRLQYQPTPFTQADTSPLTVTPLKTPVSKKATVPGK